MARPAKQTVDYFPHMTSHGPTLFILEERWGNDGYAFWFKLLETLGSKEGLHVDMNKPKNWRFFLAKTRTDEVSATEMLDCLAELGAIDPELWEMRVVFSQKFVDGVVDAFKKRKGFLPTKTTVLESFRSGNPPTSRVSGGNPSEETGKGKERKEKGKKNTPDNSVEQSDVWSDNFDESIVEFVRSFQEHVKQEMGKRAPAITETLIKSGTETVDKLIRIDGHTLEDVKDVLRWAVKDDFWQRNVLSIASLRKKSDGLTKFQKILAAKEDSARPRSGGRVPRDNNVYQSYECV